MRIIDFEGTNLQLNAPQGMEGSCVSIPARRGVDAENLPYILVCIMPNKEDRDAIAKGLPIYLKVIGNAFPPIATFTLDENDKPNFE